MELHIPTDTFGGEASTRKCRQKVGLELIENDKPIPAKYKDHTLIRYWAGRRDCHLEPDWILIYKLSDEEIVFERTGSHIDIF